MRIIVSAFVVALSACISFAGNTAEAHGPFGVHMGMQKQRLEKDIALQQDPEEDARFNSSSAPIPNRVFDSYQYLFSSESGLCQVSAMTKGAHPRQTAKIFQQLYGLLEQKYGKPSREASREIAIWHNQPLPHQLQSIGMQTIGADSRAGSFVHVVYSFQNLAGCTPTPVVNGTGL